MIIFVFPIIIIATGKADFSYMKPLFEGSKGESVMSGIGVILSMAPWAFVGFDVIPQVCEEFEFDQAKTKAHGYDDNLRMGHVLLHHSHHRHRAPGGLRLLG